MLTRRLASELLARSGNPDALRDLAAQLGFALPTPLHTADARTLGVPNGLHSPSLAVGTGVLRALLLVASADTPLRVTLTKLAQRLAAISPHQLWLALVTRADGNETAIVAWQPADTRGRTNVRVSALVLDPRRLLDSDVETLLALHAASGDADSLVHARWCEILGRDALSNRFYRALERAVVTLGEGAIGAAPSDARRELALLTASRLLFLSFLQSKGWLDGDADFLVRHFDRTLSHRGDAHRRFLEPLFFGTLNTRASRRAAAARAYGRVPFLNGGLFTRSPIESRYRTLRFRDDDLSALFDDILTRYRFTVREEHRDWSEAAIDPEMLGRAFESLMASRERRDTGAFYTPHALVERVSDAALDELFASAGFTSDERDALRGATPTPLPPPRAAHARTTLETLRVLDPACGTGAFLVHTLDRVTTLLHSSGDARPVPQLRRLVLTRSIFGVDINPMAVWLCELRLWLAVVIDLAIDDPMDVPPLPNLDRNVRVGDALAGGTLSPDPEHSARRRNESTSHVRQRYARATGRRKHALARVLDAAERKAAIADLDRQLTRHADERRALLTAARGRDLFGTRRGALGNERLRLNELRTLLSAFRTRRRSLTSGGALPFSFAAHFAHVASSDGFDIVVGNPPWVRLHRIPADRRAALRREFAVYRDAAWRRGSEDAGAGTGFGAQVDLAALFAERGLGLLRPGGVLALLLPVKLWRSLAGGGVRRLLGEQNALRQLEDWTNAPAAFDAAVYPSLIVTRRLAPTPLPSVATSNASSGAVGETPTADQAAGCVRVALHRRSFGIAWQMPRRALALDDSPGAPWLILPPDARAAFARLADAGPTLADSGIGRPTLGVKCGCNAAFLVHERSRHAHVALVAASGREGSLETAVVRPVLRGEHVRAWRPPPNDERIVWTHATDGRPLRSLPPLATRWLARWRRDLTRRSDARPGLPWWSLFRIDGAAAERPRVVWSDLGRRPRACVLSARSPVIPLNSCYVVPCRHDEDAAALAALLNSPLAAAWLDALAEPARGGFRRYLGWTVARLPIPADWDRARHILAPLGARGVAGEAVSDEELLDAAITAFRVKPATVRPLVEWTWQ